MSRRLEEGMIDIPGGAGQEGVRFHRAAQNGTLVKCLFPEISVQYFQTTVDRR